MVGRATPEKLLDYKLALQLYKTFYNQITTPDWVKININKQDSIHEPGVFLDFGNHSKGIPFGHILDRLHIHHINFVHSDMIPTNMITLCGRCHIDIHNGNQFLQ